MKSKKNLSFWYIIISLGLIVALLSFYVAINKKPENDSLLKIAKSQSQKIEKEFDTNTINFLKNQLVLSDEDLTKLSPYSNQNEQDKESSTRQDSSKLDNVNNIASNSAQKNTILIEAPESSSSAL